MQPQKISGLKFFQVQNENKNSSFLFRSGTWQNPLAMSDSILEGESPSCWVTGTLSPKPGREITGYRFGGAWVEGFGEVENQSPIPDAGGVFYPLVWGWGEEP